MSAADERRHADRCARAALQIGEQFRRVRATRGLSQEQVAFGAGLSVQTYRRLESGVGGRDLKHANPTLDTILRVLSVLEMSAVELINGG